MHTEKEKMQATAYFNALDPALVNERKRAKALCFEYNQLHPDQKGKRQQQLSKLLGKSSKSVIEAPFFCDYGYNIQVGKNFYANHQCIILDAAEVIIGDNVMLGPGVQISTTEHPLNTEQRLQGLTIARPVHIGDNVWIGMGAQILSGVSIGTNSVIAAGAVVTKDIAENVLAAGVPACVVRHLNNP
ncbi:MAG: sugar O-acetyltransferase [Pontibacterium sp.]